VLIRFIVVEMIRKESARVTWATDSTVVWLGDEAADFQDGFRLSRRYLKVLDWPGRNRN